MLTILAFAGIFSLLVFVHELGHFTTAKLAGIHVQEFGMGFPPRLLRFRRGETLYTLNLIPLGGFVKMLGEDDPTHPRSLAAQPAAVRALVISAGALMNAILPVVLFAIVFMVPQKTAVGDVVVAQVAEGSPAAVGGVLPGDVIRKVNGQRIENPGDLRYQLRLRLGATATMTIEREGQTIKRDVVPRWKPPAGEGITGVAVEFRNGRVVKESRSFFPAIGHGARRSIETLVLAKNEITGWFIGTDKPQFAGPIGIAQTTGEVAKLGILPLIEFAALLSLNLAILNILPLPALDGGRLLFVAIEVVRRGKRISPQKEALVHLAGFVVLIAAAIIISYFDIARIASGGSVLGG